MNKKLTLRLDESIIKRAKKYAKERGTSVSQLVANYFNALESEQSEQPDKSNVTIPPVTKSLVGILSDADLDEKDYRAYIEKKHQQ